MTGLPEAVEQAIREVVFAAHDTGLFASDKYVRFEIEQADALRSAILAYGAARERQGIERAAEEADRIADRYAAQREATLDEDSLTRYWAAHAVAESIRALPVDGATP